jgi:uncharacterized protein YciI
MAARPVHRERLQALFKAGELVMAGRASRLIQLVDGPVTV